MVEVKVSDDQQDALFDVLYDPEASPQQVWDACVAAKEPAVDAAINAFTDGSSVGPLGRLHFGMAVAGHLYTSNMMDRAAQALNDPNMTAGEVVERVGNLLQDSFNVMDAGFKRAYDERNKLYVSL